MEWSPLEKDHGAQTFSILPCTQVMSKLDPTISYSVGESLQSEAERGRGLRWDMASVVTGELRKVNGIRQQ